MLVFSSGLSPSAAASSEPASSAPSAAVSWLSDVSSALPVAFLPQSRLAFFNNIFKSQIFVIQVLVDHGVFHLLAELLVLQAAELDERADIIPVFLIVLSVCLEHSDQFVCNLLGNVICNFIYKSIVLQRVLDTLSGRSGQSITPFKIIRNSGITSLILSAMNT